MKFIGRREEMQFLEYQYGLDHPFVLVTGRRRVGKTRLLLEFMKKKQGMYFEADRETAAMILRSFSETVSTSTGYSVGNFDSWKAAFRSYVEHSPPGKKVIVIDEFQYITMADNGFRKEFQGIWDTYLSSQDVMLVLCGSYLGMMRKIADDYSSPLYGRITGDLLLKPLEFHETLRDNDYRRAVEEYAVTGGVPHYMELINTEDSVLSNVERLTMSVGSPLLNEPAYLLSDEFRDPSCYNTYLRVIAQGNRKADKISSAVQSPSSTVLPYLSNLIRSGMLERRVPVMCGEITHSRNGIYVIADNFTALWFRFVYPYRGQIFRGESDAAIADLRAHFIDSRVSFVFEDVSRKELRRYLRSAGIMASYGSQWNRDTEIDVVALDRNNGVVYAGECKYRDKPVGEDVLRNLRTKCARTREFDGYRVVHCVFSVSGYSERTVEEAVMNGDLLFDCGEIVCPAPPLTK